MSAEKGYNIYIYKTLGQLKPHKNDQSVMHESISWFAKVMQTWLKHYEDAVKTSKGVEYKITQS